MKRYVTLPIIMEMQIKTTITICREFGAQENQLCAVSIISPSIFHEVMGLDAMILVFLNVEF